MNIDRYLKNGSLLTLFSEKNKKNSLYHTKGLSFKDGYGVVFSAGLLYRSKGVSAAVFILFFFSQAANCSISLEKTLSAVIEGTIFLALI